MGFIMRDRARTMRSGSPTGCSRSLLIACLAVFAFSCFTVPCQAQENPLDNVITPTPPPPPKTPEELKPVITGPDVAAKATSHRDARLLVDVNLVQVPLTVTDPMNRLVTGLEEENFQVSDNNIPQTIK